jgi:Bacterial Ig-like domain (group 2)/Fibronectin type III domain
MHVRGFVALGAALLGTACQVPVDTGSSNTNVGVVSVAVQPKIASLLVGDSLQLSASVLMSNSQPSNTIAWASSNIALATVSGSGVVRGRSAGTLFVRATSGSKLDSAAITVATPSPLPVASVTVTPASATTTVGGTLQLSAALKDASGSMLAGRAITWASNNTGVAAVSAAGVVTAATAGSAIITATSEGQGGSATIAVTVPANAPGTVGDLAVAAVTDSSVTLRFTEVDGGTGTPASYDIRYATGTALSWGANSVGVSKGTCATPVAGTAVGASRTCTVLGLTAGTTYSFELVAFRGTLTMNAVFGGLSNVATGTTTGAPAGGGGQGTSYFNSNFENGTLGDLGVYPGTNGTCAVTTDAARTGTRAAKCVTTASAAAEGALWYTWGNKPGEPANPALSEANGFYQKFSIMYAPGSFANVHDGGSSAQFKMLLNRSDWHYGFEGAWFMTSWGANYGTWPPLVENNGDNCSGMHWNWPFVLQEGVWYDITTWFKRDPTTHTGHAKMWVNGVLLTDTGSYSCLGSDNAANQQQFEVGATYTQNTVGPFTVYVDDVQAANYPIGAAATALVSR